VTFTLEQVFPHAIAGGALVGAGVALSWILLGRHLCLAKDLLAAVTRPQHWPQALGLLILSIAGGGFLAYLAAGWLGADPANAARPAPLLAIAAGILSGVGLRLVGGGLLGHAVGGVSRLSRRAAVATAAMVLAAFLTGLAVRMIA